MAGKRKAIAEAIIGVVADLEKFSEQLQNDIPKRIDKAMRPIRKKLKDLSKGFEDVGKGLSATVTAPLVAVGALTLKAADDVDKALRTIKVGTGAVGDKLQSLRADFSALAGKVPAEMDVLAQSIADLNTLTGATGDTLQRLGADAVNASRLLGEDAAGNAKLLGQALKQWGESAEYGIPLVNRLFELQQKYDMGLGTGLDALNRYSGALQNAGLSMSQAAEFMARLNSAGLEIASIMPGISKALADWSEKGLDLHKTLGYVIDRIKGATTETEAITIASKIFGTEAAQKLTVGVRQGIITIDDLATSMDSATGVIQSMSDDTMTLGDRLQLLKNRAVLAGANIGGALMKTLEALQPVIIKTLDKIADLANKFAALPPETQQTIVKVAALAAALGPAMIAVSGMLTVITKLTTALTLVPRVIGLMLGPIGIVTAALISWGVVIYEVVDNWDFLVDHFRNIGSTIIAAISDATAKVKEFGASIVTGIWDGIQSKLDWLREQAAELADAIPDTVRKLLGIQSPSKVMRDIGLDMALGLVEGNVKGLKEGMKDIRDEVRRLTKSTYTIEREDAEKQADELLKLARGNAQAEADIRNWLRLKKDDIAVRELQDIEQRLKDEEQKRKEAYIKMLEDHGGFMDGIKLALIDLQDNMTTWADVAKETFTGMTDSLAAEMDTFVHDAFEGKLKSGLDYFKSFAVGVLDTFSRMLTQMAAQNLMSSIFGSLGGGLFGGGGGMLSFAGMGSTLAGAGGGATLGGIGTGAGSVGAAGVGAGGAGGAFAGAQVTGTAAGGAGIGLGTIGAIAAAAVAGASALFAGGKFMSDLTGGSKGQGLTAGIGTLMSFGGPQGLLLSRMLGGGNTQAVARGLGMGASERTGNELQRQQFGGAFEQMTGVSLQDQAGVYAFGGRNAQINADALLEKYGYMKGSLDDIVALAGQFQDQMGLTKTTVDSLTSMLITGFAKANMSALEIAETINGVATALLVSGDATAETFSTWQESAQTLGHAKWLTELQAALLAVGQDMDMSVEESKVFVGYLNDVNVALTAGGAIGEKAYEQLNELFGEGMQRDIKDTVDTLTRALEDQKQSLQDMQETYKQQEDAVRDLESTYIDAVKARDELLAVGNVDLSPLEKLRGELEGITGLQNRLSGLQKDLFVSGRRAAIEAQFAPQIAAVPQGDTAQAKEYWDSRRKQLEAEKQTQLDIFDLVMQFADVIPNLMDMQFGALGDAQAYIQQALGDTIAQQQAQFEADRAGAIADAGAAVENAGQQLLTAQGVLDVLGANIDTLTIAIDNTAKQIDEVLTNDADYMRQAIIDGGMTAAGMLSDAVSGDRNNNQNNDINIVIQGNADKDALNDATGKMTEALRNVHRG